MKNKKEYFESYKRALELLKSKDKKIELLIKDLNHETEAYTSSCIETSKLEQQIQKLKQQIKLLQKSCPKR